MNAILCTDRNHPIWPKLEAFCWAHGFYLESNTDNLCGGDLLFLVSCTERISAEIRSKYRRVFVLHESDLPSGRGWSPVAHQILEGSTEIAVSLIWAADEIDAGDIWAQKKVTIPNHFLAQEISDALFYAKADLMVRAIFWTVSPRKQEGEPTYYKRRTPEDCELDPNKTIAEQFDLLRICEPRYPAFFNHRGHKYVLEVRKA